MAEVQPIMKRVLENGRQAMVDHIETRGTGHVWQSSWGRNPRSASIPGRDDTGAMKSAVVGEVTEANAKHVEGELGWPEGSPEYFRHQEHGFYHVLAQRDVEEMGALRDASEETTNELMYELERLAKRL